MNQPRRKRVRKQRRQTDASRQAEKPISWCGGKTVATAISLFMLAIVFSPIKEHFREPRDDFPLSHYPMFTKRRDGDVTVTFLVGMDDKGRQYPIKYTYAGTGGFNQVRKQIAACLSNGRIPRCDNISRRCWRPVRLWQA